jgi:hypothetical protein
MSEEDELCSWLISAYFSMATLEMKCAASPGGTFDLTLLSLAVPVNVVQPPHTCRLVLRERP